MCKNFSLYMSSSIASFIVGLRSVHLELHCRSV
ncbi:hypothetical protein LOK49_LG04G00585 [Camellia lanceoleosa]|uniref:Uncharacterized protein n=1 Tax=Camellia lanceoleosa TaxID=1840588 RepID=A0ACC0HY88_9ERIC|nr:hypothetical protein LOK49_LG04G00585 [Camellia lanceoleosa]